MKKITSIHNLLIRSVIKSLDKNIIAHGHKLIESAINAKQYISHVFISEDYIDRYLWLIDKITTADFFTVSNAVQQKLTSTNTPQGIAAVVKWEYTDIKNIPLSKKPLIVVCDSIQDPNNIGAIIRAADAFSASAVILLQGCADVYNPKTVRASAGSIFNIPISKFQHDKLISFFKENNIKFFVSDVRAKKSIFEVDFKQACAIVVGNESIGVSAMLREKAQGQFHIPIYGAAESLNVSIAAAVIMYEAIRQRQSVKSFYK